MFELMKESLERIESLHHYYEVTRAHIEDEAKKGKERTFFGHITDMFFAALASEKKEIIEDEGFERIKEFVGRYLDNIEIKDTSSGKRAFFSMKNIEELQRVGLVTDIKKAAIDYRQYSDMPIIHGDDALISLLIRFEEFISMLLSLIFQKYPQQYLDDQKVAFSEIVDLGTEEVRTRIISRRVDEMMRQSYSEWIKLFEKHGMKFDTCKEELATLKEMYARRNVIVHNGGCVNEIYLANTKVKIDLGTRLYIDKPYIEKAFETIEIIILCILVEAVRFIEKENRNDYLYSVFEQTFEKLIKEEFNLCKVVYNAIANSKESNAELKLLSNVNYWIAMKALNQFDKIRSEIKAYDFSACAKRYNLAEHILLEEYDEACVILEEIYNKEIDCSQLKEWPLFRDFRNTEQYKKFQEQHAEDFSVTAIEVDANATDETISIISETQEGFENIKELSDNDSSENNEQQGSVVEDIEIAG